MSDIRGDDVRSDSDLLSARLTAASSRIAPKSPAEALQPELVPPPPRRSRAARHPLVVFFNFLFTIVFVSVVVIGAALLFGKMQFERPSGLDQPRTVAVNRGIGLSDIGDLLQKTGVISSKWLFVAGVWLNRQQNSLKAGEYLIPARASMEEIMDLMVEGRGILYSIAIPEGLTSEQIVQRLRDNDVLVGEIAEIPTEGSLLPETYKFSRGDTRQGLLDRMRAERDRVVSEVWNRRASDVPLANMEELVVLASIVEEETALADERSQVAAVFINRLRLNMKLQSDPTVLYGLFGGKGRPADYRFTRADLEKGTPYNTYVIPGLPPGPISNPGRASLEAVGNPSRTRDLFFVADGSGGHAFAENYEAHLRNVSRWRQINAADAAEAEAETDAATADSAEPTDATATDQPLALTPPTRPVQ